MVPENYDNELLQMAHDLAARLLPAFDSTATGIPYPRVSFMKKDVRDKLKLSEVYA